MPGTFKKNNLTSYSYPLFTDLSTMWERLKSNYYVTKSLFIADMMRMFHNCRTYNQQDSYLYRSANTLERYFINKMKEADLWP